MGAIIDSNLLDSWRAQANVRESISRNYDEALLIAKIRHPGVLRSKLRICVLPARI